MSPVSPFEISEASFPQGKIPGKFKHAWIENCLPESTDANSRWQVSATKNFLGTSITGRTIGWFAAVLVAGLAIIVGRSSYLQLGRGDHYLWLAENNRLRVRPILAERGIFFDRAERPLVQNVPNFILSVVPQDLPPPGAERLGVVGRLSVLSDIPKNDLLEIFKKTGSLAYNSIVLKENLDYNAAVELYVAHADLPGVIIESGMQRLYLYSTSTLSTAHVLGYLGKLDPGELEAKRDRGYLANDFIGKSGLEKIYEVELRGTPGRKKVEVNALGKEQNVVAVEPPRPGHNIILSLDLEAQQELERGVRSAAASLGRRRLAAVALDPKSGAILALVSWPSYDNNIFSGTVSSSRYAKYLADPDQPLFNRAISGLYPSGSTIKPLVAAAALQENVINRHTTIISRGGLQRGDHWFPDWNPLGHGPTDVVRALAWSINTFFYYIGGGYETFAGLGIDRLHRYLTQFGLGSATGIDLPAEKSGLVPAPAWKQITRGEPWYIGDTYNLSIGQGDILVTPLQVAVWTAAIANGGSVVTPHLVTKVVDPITQKIVLSFSPRPRSALVDQRALSVVGEGMAACVQTGSCSALNRLTFTSAGKTGTAQWSSNRPTHAWFTAFAPASNPQVVITVLIEEGGEGGVVATPVARDWLAWWGKKYLTPR